MIFALLIAASPLHAQVISPILGRVVSAPIAIHSVTSLNPLSLAPTAVPLAALAVSVAPADVSAPVSAITDLARAAGTDHDGIAPSQRDFWDGRTLNAAAESAARTAPWLAVRDVRLARALDAAVVLARTTTVGRRAFAAAEKAVAAQGGALAVDILDLGRNFGEFDYLSGRLRLHRKLFAPGRKDELAATLIHELTHLAQHAAGLPSYALELEIEAHLQDLEMLAELGRTPHPNTFSRQALDALTKGPAAFVELIQAAVPGPYLGENSLDDVIDSLEQDLDAASRRKSERSVLFARAIADDIDRLRTPQGAAAYRAFSRRVRAMLERRSAAAKG